MSVTDSKPTVSIGMPVYNGGQQVIRALDSLLSQQYKNFELIVSDNASTDQTGTICQEYARKDKRIKYIRQKENLGAIRNLEFVLEQSTGEYFMWAAHDDEWDARFINSMLQVLERHRNVSVAFRQTTYALKNDGTVLPRFLQGVPLDSPLPRSSKRRLHDAVHDNYGELFYGVYRKRCLISDDIIGHNTVNFEVGGLIHSVLKAMLNGDAYVSRDFYFTKGVSMDVYLWTYLCAKKKSILATNTSIERMLEQMRNRNRAVLGETIIGRLRHYVVLVRSILVLGDFHFHWLYLRGALKTVDNANTSYQRRLLSLKLHIMTLLMGDCFWTAATRIRWRFALW